MHIDWSTLALQTVNVLILIWLLGRFFFRPVADLVARRKEEAARTLADAEAARKQAEDMRTEADRLRAAVNAERDRLLGEARKAAETEKTALLAQLSVEAEKQRETEKAEIARQRAAMAHDVLAHASELSVEIARRLLERIPASTLFSAFLADLGGTLRKLQPDAREGLAVAGAEQPMEVIAAAPLDDEQTASLLELLRAALGVEPVVKIACDKALIAGFEVRSRNLILRTNWQADLARIRRELDR